MPPTLCDNSSAPAELSGQEEAGNVERGNRSLCRRVTSFVVAITCVAVLWLGVLPRVGEHPALKRYMDRNEELGVHPGAKFYTELPGMEDFLDRIQTAHRIDGAAFWRLPQSERVDDNSDQR